jgi:hypothetical protein
LLLWFARSRLGFILEASTAAQTPPDALLGKIKTANSTFEKALTACTNATAGTTDKDRTTITAWQALAGEIVNIVVGDGGLPDSAKAGELATVFENVDGYCYLSPNIHENTHRQRTKRRCGTIYSK